MKLLLINNAFRISETWPKRISINGEGAVLLSSRTLLNTRVFFITRSNTISNILISSKLTESSRVSRQWRFFFLAEVISSTFKSTPGTVCIAPKALGHRLIHDSWCSSQAILRMRSYFKPNLGINRVKFYQVRKTVDLRSKKLC